MLRPTNLLVPVAISACVLVPSDANANYRFLCTSVPSACEYIPDDNPPTLNADVCYGSTGVFLKGTGSCPTGFWPYTVIFGEVTNPTTNAVQGYIPLDNACEFAGLCVEYVPHSGGQSAPICCDEEYTCYPTSGCGGTIWWCHDGVSNEDGTVTCFHAEEI